MKSLHAHYKSVGDLYPVQCKAELKPTKRSHRYLSIEVADSPQYYHYYKNVVIVYKEGTR